MQYQLKKALYNFSKLCPITKKLYSFASKIKTKKMMSLSDEEFLKQKFLEGTGKPLNLDNPQTFNEKLQWLKLYDRRPEYTIMADKYRSKKWVADLVGEQYVVPTYGVWESFDDIDFDVLPEQFVLKCNHDCGSIVICKDKRKLNKNNAQKILDGGLKHNYFGVGREWPYKNIKPLIFAEKYLESDTAGGIFDYKLLCFSGKCNFVFVFSDRQIGKLKLTPFDLNWNPLSFRINYPCDERPISKPHNLNEMVQVSEKLSAGVPVLRTDFFISKGKIYVGELTFFHNGGMGNFFPEEWDRRLGEMIQLHKSYKTCE